MAMICAVEVGNDHTADAVLSGWANTGAQIVKEIKAMSDEQFDAYIIDIQSRLSSLVEKSKKGIELSEEETSFAQRIKLLNHHINEERQKRDKAKASPLYKWGFNATETDGKWMVSRVWGKFSKQQQAVMRDSGGKRDKSGKGYLFADDPTEALKAALKDFPPEPRPDARTTKEKEVDELLDELEEGDEGIFIDIAQDIDAVKHLGKKVIDFLFAGVPKGKVKEEAAEDQAKDAASIVKSYKEGKGGFVLALPTGSGKTFVMTAAMDEMLKDNPKEGDVGKIIFVTTSQPLINQVRGDGMDKQLGDKINQVQFVTYAGIANNTTGIQEQIADVQAKGQKVVIMFDESQNIIAKETGASARSGIGSDLVDRADFSVFSSATPFTTLSELSYLSNTGLFDDFEIDPEDDKFDPREGYEGINRGFHGWVRQFGVDVSPSPEGEGFKESSRNVTSLDILNARVALMEMGAYTYRHLRIDPEMTEITFPELSVGNAEMEEILSKVWFALERAKNMVRQSGGVMQVAARQVNTIKRLNELAKVDDAVNMVKETLDSDGGQAILSFQTKAPLVLGRWRKHESYGDDTLYTYEDMMEMMAAWEGSSFLGDNAPPPFTEATMVMARIFAEEGLVMDLPSPMQRLREEFGDTIVEFHGGISNQQRKVAVDQFNRGEKRLMIMTSAAGGAGLSLHDVIGKKPRTLIVLDMPWRETDFVQLIGRATRYGMQSKVRIMVPYTPNSIEAHVAGILSGKVRKMNILVSGASKPTEKRMKEKIVYGEEEVDETQKTSLTDYMNMDSETAEGYSESQMSLIHAFREIIRIGSVNPAAAGINGINLALDKADMPNIEPGSAMDRLVTQEGIRGAVRELRSNLMGEIGQMLNEGKGSEVVAVVNDLDTYLATRNSKRFKVHSKEYGINIKGGESMTLTEIVRYTAEQELSAAGDPNDTSVDIAHATDPNTRDDINGPARRFAFGNSGGNAAVASVENLERVVMLIAARINAGKAPVEVETVRGSRIPGRPAEAIG
ncbi:MAG: helicase-related protein, partial [Pseudomonadales bacterium]